MIIKIKSKNFNENINSLLRKVLDFWVRIDRYSSR